MVAPTALSVFDQPTETLKFLTDLQRSLQRRHSDVTVDLSEVQSVSSDALLLMRSMIDDAKGIFRRVGGNLPSNAGVTAKFKQSGFFAGFTKPPGKLPQPQGLIRRHAARQVQSSVAGELVQFAIDNASISDSVSSSSYKAFVELMSNTNNHAGLDAKQKRSGRAERKERWRASVYCEDGVATFTFIDLGVGILKSAAPRTFLQNLGVKVFSYGEERLLGDVFHGLVGASEHIPGRGFGLPRLMAMAKDGSLPQLQVLTSSVMAEVATLSVRSVNVYFRGTAFRWRSDQAPIEP